MATATRLALRVGRWTGGVRRIQFRGLDIATLEPRVQVRLSPDTPGNPLLNLGIVTSTDALGLRMLPLETIDGVTVSTIALQFPRAVLGTALPAAADTGDDAVLAWEMVLRLGSDYYQAVAFGDFVVEAGVVGSDAAVAQLGSGGQRTRAGDAAGTGVITIGDATVRVSIDALDLVAPLADATKVAAAAADVSARQALAAQTDIVARIGDLRVLPFEHATYSHAIVDAASNILALIERATGRWKLALTMDSIIPGALSPAISAADIDENASGWLLPVIDKNGGMLGGWKRDGTFLASFSPDCAFPGGIGGGASLQAVREMLAAAKMGIPSARIYASGDSLTAGAGGAVSYVQVMAAALGLPFVNTAVGGTRSDSIGVRQGGIAMTVTIAGNSLPAGTGEVDVTAYSVDFTNNQSAQQWAGVAAGVPVILTRYGQSSDASLTQKYTLQRRTAGGTAVDFPPGTRFFADVFTGNELDYHYIQAGRNGPRGVQTRDHILRMIDRIGHDRFGILPIKNGAGEGIGTNAYGSVMEGNRLIQEAVGWHWVDTRKYLASRQALTDAAITPTQQDLDDIAVDTIPASLRADAVHGNTANYQIEGLWVSRWHRGNGWSAGI